MPEPVQNQNNDNDDIIDVGPQVETALMDAIMYIGNTYKIDISVKNLKALTLILADIGFRLVYNRSKSIEDLEDVSQMLNGRIEDLIDALKKENG